MAVSKNAKTNRKSKQYFMKDGTEVEPILFIGYKEKYMATKNLSNNRFVEHNNKPMRWDYFYNILRRED